MKIKRIIYSDLRAELAEPQLLVLVGPRQVGKTTLMRRLDSDARAAGHRTRSLDLEQPSDLTSLQGQPAEVIERLTADVDLSFVDEFYYLEDAGRHNGAESRFRGFQVARWFSPRSAGPAQVGGAFSQDCPLRYAYRLGRPVVAHIADHPTKTENRSVPVPGRVSPHRPAAPSAPRSFRAKRNRLLDGVTELRRHIRLRQHLPAAIPWK